MEDLLGRYLDPSEVVHHKDLNPSNNDPSNLELYSNNSIHLIQNHTKIDMTKRRCLYCNGKTRVDKRGYECWYVISDTEFVCSRCYSKAYR